MAGRYTNTVAVAADLSAWALGLGEMAYDDKPADISKDRSRKTIMKTVSLVFTLSRRELRSSIQVEKKFSR